MWSLMASAPALLLGVMGIVGRTQISTWEFESYSPQENLALIAYQEPVRRARLLRLQNPTEPQFSSNVQKAAALWIQGHDEGLLLDILPGSLEDQGSNGAKGQISEARQHLINSLQMQAGLARESGSQVGYCLAHATIVRVADIGKYSGVASIQQGALIQLGSLKRIADHWPNLTQAERSKVLLALHGTRKSEEPLNVLAERLSHLAIRRRMTNNDSMKDLSRVFHASHLASLAPPEGMKLTELKERAKDVGLDPILGVSLSASLRAEEKFRSALEEIKILNASPQVSPLQAESALIH